MNLLEVIHPYDWVMIIILVVTTLLGAWKGMAWQVASLASVVLSFLVAVRFSPLVAPLFGSVASSGRKGRFLVTLQPRSRHASRPASFSYQQSLRCLTAGRRLTGRATPSRPPARQSDDQNEPWC